MTKLLHCTAMQDGRDHAGAEVGEPEFTDLVDRIFDKGMVVDAADRIALMNEDAILGAHEKLA